MIRCLAAAGAVALLAQVSAPALARPVPAASTRSFVAAEAQSDEFERRTGRMAERMARSPQVRAFAGRMVHDHILTTEKLQMALRQNGRPVPPPLPLGPDRQQMLDQLSMAGPGFDRVYMGQQVQAHQRALSLMQAYARNGDDPAIRRVASETVPLIRHHLEMAMRLQDGVRR